MQPEPDVPLFREFARRWRPLMRVKRKVVPFQLVVPTGDSPAITRGSFGPKRPVFSTEQSQSARTWNPWMWMK